MSPAVVSIEPLLRRLAETPASLQLPPCMAENPDGVRVDAVVRDVLESMGPPGLGPGLPVMHSTEIRALVRGLAAPARSSERTLRATLVTAWLLADPVFTGADEAVRRATDFFAEVVPMLAGAVEPSLLVTDADRREELARRALAAFEIPVADESPDVSADRLAALDSVGRSTLLRDAWARLRRAREVREAMRRKEAEESAARWGGE